MDKDEIKKYLDQIIDLASFDDITTDNVWGFLDEVECVLGCVREEVEKDDERD
tara:strand:- start:19517 stop:19675 length:159 start_codon:yes stop_codon:yes gene_type:complete